MIPILSILLGMLLYSLGVFAFMEKALDRNHPEANGKFYIIESSFAVRVILRDFMGKEELPKNLCSFFWNLYFGTFFVILTLACVTFTACAYIVSVYSFVPWIISKIIHAPYAAIPTTCIGLLQGIQLMIDLLFTNKYFYILVGGILLFSKTIKYIPGRWEATTALLKAWKEKHCPLLESKKEK